MDMRDLILIVEAELEEDGTPKHRNMPHKPFSNVTVDDVIRAFFDIDDVRDVMESGWWDDMCGEWFEDMEDEYIPVPRSSAQLTDDYMDMCREHMTKLIKEALARIAPVAAKQQIPIRRQLNRLSDLSQPLGIHWSWADAEFLNTKHYGSHTIYGLVANENVDWITSIARGTFWWWEESEITPVRGSAITLTRLDFGDGAQGAA